MLFVDGLGLQASLIVFTINYIQIFFADHHFVSTLLKLEFVQLVKGLLVV